MGISCQFGDSKETGVLKLCVSSCEVRLRFSSCSISWSCYSCKQRCDICSLHGVAMFCYVSCRPMHIQRPFPATMSETVLYQVLCFFSLSENQGNGIASPCPQEYDGSEFKPHVECLVVQGPGTKLASLSTGFDSSNRP